MTDHRNRTKVESFSNIEVKVFKSGIFKGITHILQEGDTVALSICDIENLIIALLKAKQALKAE